MTHALTDYGIYTVNVFGNSTLIVISDLTINSAINNLNYATFECPQPLTTGSIIEIRYQTVDVAFTGKVTQCRKLARGVSNITRYEVEITERAIELQNMYISNATQKGIWFNNVSETKTLGEYVGYILEYSGGWKDVSDAQFKNKVVSGLESTDAIPSIGFGRCTVFTALQRLIVSLCSYGLWFEYTNGERLIRYGEYNRSQYVTETPLDITVHESVDNYEVDGIVVYGEKGDNDRELMAIVGDVSTGNRTLAYRYSGCYSQTELNSMAKRIFDDRKLPRTRYEVHLPAPTGGFYKINEGDRLHIYDPSIGMEESADGYGVKDVTVTTEKVVVGIGAPKVTVFDLFNDKLSIIDGDVLSVSEQADVTGFGNVFTAASADEWGEEVSVIFNIGATGDTFLGDFFVIPVFGAIGSTGLNYKMIYSAVAATQDFIVEKGGTSAYFVFNGEGTEAYEPILTSDMFPWSWDEMEVEVNYGMSQDNVENALAVWDFVYPGLYVIDREGEQPIPTQAYMGNCKWYISQVYKTPFPADADVYVSCAHGGSGDEVIISTAQVSMTVRYTTNVSPDPSGSLETGTLQMKIDSNDWFTIYDTTDISAYTDVKYDMKNYISDYKNFVCGSHTFTFRCKGSHPTAAYPGIGVNVGIMYLSLEGNIRVIS